MGDSIVDDEDDVSSNEIVVWRGCQSDQAVDVTGKAVVILAAGTPHGESVTPTNHHFGFTLPQPRPTAPSRHFLVSCLTKAGSRRGLAGNCGGSADVGARVRSQIGAVLRGPRRLS